MAATKNGVYYNLHESIYRFNIPNQKQRITLYFSSRYNFTKYMNNVEPSKIDITFKIQNRYKMNINLELLNAIYLYSKIEKRGFLIDIEGVKVSCLDNLKLDGLQVNVKS